MIQKSIGVALVILSISTQAFAMRPLACRDKLDENYRYHRGWVGGNIAFSFTGVAAFFTVPNAVWNNKMKNKFLRARDLLTEALESNEKFIQSAVLIPKLHVEIRRYQAGVSLFAVREVLKRIDFCACEDTFYHDYEKALKWDNIRHTVLWYLGTPQGKRLLQQDYSELEKQWAERGRQSEVQIGTQQSDQYGSLVDEVTAE